MRVKQLPNALTRGINRRRKEKEETEEITWSMAKLAE
jgi:hypothetical protein